MRGLRQKQSWFRKFKEKVIKTRLIPSASVDPMGQASFSISPDFTSEKDVKDLIQDTFTALSTLGESTVVAIDEFQKKYFTLRTMGGCRRRSGPGCRN